MNRDDIYFHFDGRAREPTWRLVRDLVGDNAGPLVEGDVTSQNLDLGMEAQAGDQGGGLGFECKAENTEPSRDFTAEISVVTLIT